MKVISKMINNTRGGGATILLVFFVSVVFVTLIGTYQKAINNYQKRHFQLKENYSLLEATETLAILVRQAYDVARMAPHIGGIPQCPLPGGGTASAEANCFKSGGCHSPSEFTYFCWADVTNPSTKCAEGPGGRQFCFGSNSESGSRDDVLPVQVSYNPEAKLIAQKKVKQLFGKHWSDYLGPLPNLFLNAKVQSFSWILDIAQAETTIAYADQPALMSTSSCVAANEFCKNCSVENGCVRISICPSFMTNQECQDRPNDRFTQYILFTN